jgi:hypothetical protein
MTAFDDFDTQINVEELNPEISISDINIDDDDNIDELFKLVSVLL